jgi:hypothetical protein
MTTKKDILKALRAKCIECCCDNSHEVGICHIDDCPLWTFRSGKDPVPSRGFTGLRPSVQTSGRASNTTE